MTTWRRDLAHVMRRRLDQVLDGEDLRGRHEIVVSRREQEQRAAHMSKLDPLAERQETAARQLVLLEQAFDGLEIVGPGQIDRRFIPIAETGFERAQAGRADGLY